MAATTPPFAAAQSIANHAEHRERMVQDEIIAAGVKTTGIVKLGTIEPMIANKAAFHAARDELHVLPLNPVAA